MGGRDEVFDLAQVRVDENVVTGGHGSESACRVVYGCELSDESVASPEHSEGLGKTMSSGIELHDLSKFVCLSIQVMVMMMLTIDRSNDRIGSTSVL
jgi:hypothetical protein